MFCKKCGTELTETARFCNHCGTPASVGSNLDVPHHCPSCGAEIKSAARFCMACGQPASGATSQPLASQSQRPAAGVDLNELIRKGSQTVVEIKEKSSSGQKISLSATLLVLLCFFLPWVEVSCLGLRQTLSGYELAVGSETYGGLLGLWLVPLCMILTLGLVYAQVLRKTRNNQQEKEFAYGVIGAGGLSLLVLLFEYLSTMSQLRRDPLFGRVLESMISFQFGAIVSLLGCLAVVVGGLLHLGVDVRTLVSRVVAHSAIDRQNSKAVPVQTAANEKPPPDPSPPTEPATQSKVCLGCGSSVRPNAAFCASCGARM